MAGLPMLETTSFIAFFADNRSAGLHRAGYNGIVSLIPRSTGNNLLVPLYAGLNYETIWLPGLAPYNKDGVIFEPRCEPMRIESADSGSVVLVQPETGHAHVNGRLTFTVEEPCYVHQRIELTPHRRFCSESEPNLLRCLFASYIHMPPDRHIYLKPDWQDGAPLESWFGLTKAEHRSPTMEVRRLPGERELTAAEHLEAMQTQEPLSEDEISTLPNSLDAPLAFYYGLCHDLLFLMMFKRPEQFRLAYSPNGGGRQPEWSPAWDYVLHQPNAAVGQTYTWDLCLAVKPYEGRRQVLEEVRRYVGTGA